MLTSPIPLSLKVQKAGQKAKARGTIKEIPENSSYTKNNLSNATARKRKCSNTLNKLV